MGSSHVPLRKTDGWQRHIILSDLHGPYLDKRAWNVVLGVLKETPITACWLNGDVADFSQISRHERKIFIDRNFIDDLSLEEELFLIQEDIFRPLRKAVGKNTKIVYRQGNHDIRVAQLAESNPTVLATMLKTILRHRSFYLDDLLQMKKYGIEFSQNPIDILFDCYTLVHGARTGPNAARWNLNRYGSGTSGHTHKISEAMGIVRGKLSSWHESGCLRTIDKVEYMAFGDKPEWCHGFLELCINPNLQKWFCHSYKIIDYRTDFRGQIFTA